MKCEVEKCPHWEKHGRECGAPDDAAKLDADCPEVTKRATVLLSDRVYAVMHDRKWIGRIVEDMEPPKGIEAEYWDAEGLCHPIDPNPSNVISAAGAILRALDIDADIYLKETKR